MQPQRFARYFAPVALAVILAAAGCGSSGSSDSTGGSSTSGSTSGTSSGTGSGTGSTGTGSSGTVTVSISAQPQDVKAAVGTAASLAVTATGSGTLSYQWYKGGAAVSGATSATYSIASLAAANAGRYYVRVADANGSVASATAVVTPTSGGLPVDAWDLNDGFNPADQISNVTFPYAVTLTGSSNGISIAASGLTTSSTSSTRITFTDGSNTVVVDTGANPIAVTSTVTSGAVKFVLGGTFSAGLKFTSTAQFGLALSDVTVASDNGAAIYINSAVRAFVVLSGINTLTESSPVGAAANAAFYTKGSLVFSGGGSLSVTSGAAYESNAVQAKLHVRLSEGTLNLKTRYNPSSKDVNTSNVYALTAVSAFVMDGGVLIITSADELTGAAKSIPAGWGRGVGVKGAEGSTGFLVVNDGILSITTYDKAMTAKWKCYDSTAPADSDGDRVCDSNDPNPFVTINGGSLTIRATGVPCDPTDRMTYNTTTCTGTTSTKVSPEGIEAKSILTVNGGTIDIQTTDDAVNAGIGYANPYGNAIIINGGYLNAASSGNDGIDANARANPGITVNGGVVIANGIGAPEEGFDADMYTVALNGGTAIGTGGGNSSVDSKSTAGYAAITGVTLGKTLAIWKGTSSTGSLAFAYQVPSTTGTTGNTSRSALVTSGALLSGGSYTSFLTSASNVTCSEWFHGLCVGTMSATYANLGTGTTLTVR
jgi:hypothetical protein